MVPQGDEFGPDPVGDLVEKGVALPPTCFLQRQALGSGISPHVAPLYRAGQPTPLRLIGDKAAVGRRIRTQRVV